MRAAKEGREGCNKGREVAAKGPLDMMRVCSAHTQSVICKKTHRQRYGRDGVAAEGPLDMERIVELMQAMQLCGQVSVARLAILPCGQAHLSPVYHQ